MSSVSDRVSSSSSSGRTGDDLIIAVLPYFVFCRLVALDHTFDDGLVLTYDMGRDDGCATVVQSRSCNVTRG